MEQNKNLQTQNNEKKEMTNPIKRRKDPTIYGDGKMVKTETVYTSLLENYKREDLLEARQRVYEATKDGYNYCNPMVEESFKNRAMYIFHNVVLNSLEGTIMGILQTRGIDIIFDRNAFMNDIIQNPNTDYQYLFNLSSYRNDVLYSFNNPVFSYDYTVMIASLLSLHLKLGSRFGQNVSNDYIVEGTNFITNLIKNTMFNIRVVVSELLYESQIYLPNIKVKTLKPINDEQIPF